MWGPRGGRSVAAARGGHGGGGEEGGVGEGPVLGNAHEHRAQDDEGEERKRANRRPRDAAAALLARELGPEPRVARARARGHCARSVLRLRSGVDAAALWKPLGLGC